MAPLPGISGSLFPQRFLADEQRIRLPHATARGPLERRRRDLAAWWSGAALVCGPATGVRTLFDVVAMPMLAMLGFRANDARFGPRGAWATLLTPAGTPVGAMVCPWAASRPTAWRDAVHHAREVGARWCLVIAPPFLTIVDARGQACRRAVELMMPAVVQPISFQVFWELAAARAFDAARGAPATGRAAHIETLAADAMRFQDRVRVDLQDGVLGALDDLPRVLTSRMTNRMAGAEGDAFSEALTIVYRILFLLFAEARDLVPAGHPVYGRAYAVTRLCDEALAGEAHGLWDALAAVTRLSRSGCRSDDLIVKPFNGRLFARAAAPTLERRRSEPRLPRAPTARSLALQRTLVALGTRPGRAGREGISYADLGVEQLGAVYERVLDLKSGQRKQTGTFYTPQPLAEFVVRRTLAPLVAGRSSDAILDLRVVDPAMGSGAFLVAACQFLAEACEHRMIEEGRWSSADVTDADRADLRRLVAERCLAGVDVNPVAVQLARLSLWLTTLARGKPLGFLDHQLRTGNSLIGAAPEDLRRLHHSPRARRRPGGPTGTPLFDAGDLAHSMRDVARPLRQLRLQADDEVADVRAKEALWRQLTGSRSPIARWRLALSLWCAQWFWPDEASGTRTRPPGGPELRAAADAILRDDGTLPAHHLARWMNAADAASQAHGFFHWPLEFADVFYEADGRQRDRPGFDAVIGNPPWEMLRRDPEAGGRQEGTARTGDSSRRLVRFVRESGLYPSCGRGHLNLYQPFIDRALSIMRPGGRVGLVLPWSLATDDGASSLRARLLDHAGLDTLVGLDNADGLFPIHRGLRFAALTAGRQEADPRPAIRARFGVRSAAALEALPGRDDGDDASAFPVRFEADELAALGGFSRRIPDVRTSDDLTLLRRLRRAFPPLGSEQGWHLSFSRELNATDDRRHFSRTGLPVLDGKHLQPFVADLGTSARCIPRAIAERRFPDRRFDRPRLAYRDVSGVGNRLSLIAAIVPAGAVTTHTVFCLRTRLSLERQRFLLAVFNSYVMNAVVRLLMGSHVTTSLVAELPVPFDVRSSEVRDIATLAARLEATPASALEIQRAEDAEAAAQAAVGHLYGFDRQAFGRLLDRFALVPEKTRAAARAAFERQPRRG